MSNPVNPSLTTHRTSLRYWLTLPYVALVLVLAVTIGALSYNAGRHAVSTLTDKLLLETIDRIGQAIDRHVVGSAAVLEAAFPDGLPAPASMKADMDELRSRFWIATTLHIDPNNYVYYGNKAGHFFGLWRHSLEEGELRLKLDADKPRTISRFTGLHGEFTSSQTEERIYDPRTRPWYVAGQANPSHTWTSIYIDYRNNELVATRARRVLDAQGQFDGVVATDLSLRALNDFVRRLRLSGNGLAFIVEKDGNLIASSRSANVARNPAGTNTRTNAAESTDPTERAAFEAVTKALAANPTKGSLSFVAPDGAAHELAYARLKDVAGLEWLVAVAMPRSDLMGGISQNVIRTGLLATAAAALAALLGLGILQWIARDLARLANAARAVGEGQLDVPVQVHRQDEIGEVADCFRQMQARLRTDHLTGLVNRGTLFQAINERIHQHRRAGDSAPFGVLFIDIDGFKLVNDRLGHDTGDRLLVDIGARLRAATRSMDIVARYAGDEFVVLIDAAAGRTVLEQVREKIERTLKQTLPDPREQGLPPVTVSASVGLAMFEPTMDTAEELLSQADAEMYQRKAAQKDTDPTG